MGISYKPRRASAIAAGIVLITFPVLLGNKPLLLAQPLGQKPQASARTQPSKKAEKTPKTLREGTSIKIGFAKVAVKKVGRNSVVLEVDDPTDNSRSKYTVTALPGNRLNLSRNEFCVRVASIDKKGGVLIQVTNNE